MCSWTSKYAILRDLSEAQGHVPSEIDGTVGTEPPPALELTEETEEEYYRSYVGEGDCLPTAPNLGLIKEMLDMVNDAYSNDQELGAGDAGVREIITIKKLDPNSKDFVPIKQNLVSNTDNERLNHIPPASNSDKKQKPKRARNVAVASLLEALNKNEVKESFKLMKPDDFIDSTVAESVLKVDGWLKSQNQNGTSKMVPNLTPGISMFKRKETTVKKVLQVEPQKSPSLKNEKYTPSVLAKEYYNKFVEKAKLNEKVREDIWTKTERLMKEADAEKREQLAEQEDTSKETSKLDKLDVVRLPQHRHQLTEECIVCKTMCVDKSKQKVDLIL